MRDVSQGVYRLLRFTELGKALFMVAGRVEESFGIFTINVHRLENLGGGMN